jgi:hypothetical protein
MNQIEINQEQELLHMEIEDSNSDQHSPNLYLHWSFDQRLIERIRQERADSAYVAVIVGTYLAPEAIRAQTGHISPEEFEAKKALCQHPERTADGGEPITCEHCKDLPAITCSCEDCRDGRFFAREEAFIFPLDRKEALIQLQKSGDFIVSSALMLLGDFDKSSKKQARASLYQCLHRHDGDVLWKADELHEDGINVIPTRTVHPIHINPLFFATQRPKWLIWWVELFLGSLKNECRLLWYGLFAFSIQSILVGTWILLRALIGFVVAVGLLLAGWRHVTLTPLFHPFKHDIFGFDSKNLIKESDLKGLDGEVKDDPYGNFITYNADHIKRGKIGKILHTPLFWVALVGFAGVLSMWPRKTIVYVSLVILLIFLFVLVLLCYNAIERALLKRQRESAPLQRTLADRLIHLEQASTQFDPIQIIRSSALHHKARHCRPFAKT